MEIESKIFEELKKSLSSFGSKYFIGEDLNRSKISDDLRNYNEALLEKLFQIDFIKQHFIKEVAGQKLFQIEQLEEAILYNDYWDTSYTKYENRIGLASKGKFLEDSQDVVLDFPFKDGVLTASMTKEDNEDGYDDAFLNEVIEKDEIDRLFDKKIFVNSKRYDKNGESVVTEFSEDTDNLIIKGNNLLALHTLIENYTGIIKLIYIDPPYNTGSDSFLYNDNFNHSAWIAFMKNRLEIAKELLSNDGIIAIQTDDSEQSYLKVLCDSIFGRSNYLNTVSMKTKSISGASGGREDKRLKKNVEFLTIYSKNRTESQINSIQTLRPIDEVVQEYRETGVSWKYTPLLLSPGEEKYIGSTVDGSGAEIKIFKCVNPIISSIPKIMKEKGITEKEAYNQYGKYAFDSKLPQSSIRPRVMEKFKEILHNEKNELISIEYVPRTGRNKGKLYKQFYKGDNFRLLAWLSDVSVEKDGQLYKADKLGTFWDVVGFMNNIGNEGNVEFNNAKKPEQLLQKIIELTTDDDDLILDFFMGSATTQAVAMKMNRRFIGIEQMDYINEVSVPRLQKVIAGEQGGISKDVKWQGGGSFVYTELMPKNMGYLQDIIHSKTLDELKVVYHRMLEGTDSMEPADISFRADLNKIDWMEGFVENKRLLIKLLDKNGLYYNYSEIDDVNVRELISDNDYLFNKQFYKGGE